jgi:hypothetical protein
MDVSKTIEDMMIAQELVRQMVAELQDQGVPDVAIASVLFNAAGGIWRDAFPVEAERRKVVSHAAEVAISGKAWSTF